MTMPTIFPRILATAALCLAAVGLRMALPNRFLRNRLSKQSESKGNRINGFAITIFRIKEACGMPCRALFSYPSPNNRWFLDSVE